MTLRWMPGLPPQLTQAARAAVIATMSECLPEATANRLMSAGIVPFFGVDEALDALNAAAMIGNCTAPQPVLSSQTRHGSATTLSEQTPRLCCLATDCAFRHQPPATISQAGETARVLAFRWWSRRHRRAGPQDRSGWCGAQCNHRCKTPSAAADAMSGICNEVLVEQMITGTVAELIIGVTRDPQFGLALVVGAGGILTELVADSTVLLLPATRKDIEAACVRSKCSG
jgi:acyl-CoA synthetase (NDP forming)